MDDATLVAVRLPAELVDRLDAFAATYYPRGIDGRPSTRSEALRHLADEALRVIEADRASAKEDMRQAIDLVRRR